MKILRILFCIVFVVILLLLLIPHSNTRFSGRKIASRHPFPVADYSPDELISFAVLATCVHKWSAKWETAVAKVGMKLVPGLEGLEGLRCTERCTYHPDTGLKVLCFESLDASTRVLTFGAVNAIHEIIGKEQSPNLWNSVVYNLVGGIPLVYEQAAQFVQHYRKQHQNTKRLVLVGHSLGGSLASYAGMMTNVHVVAFNSLPLGAGIQQQLGARRLEDAGRWVTHVCVENDFFAENALANKVDEVLSHMDIRTPGNWGRRVLIPAAKAYSSRREIHNYFLSSLLEFYGLPHRLLP